MYSVSKIAGISNQVGRLPSLAGGRQPRRIRPTGNGRIGLGCAGKVSNKIRRSSVDIKTKASSKDSNTEAVSVEESEEGWQRTAKLGLLFGGWYGANVVFNMYQLICVSFVAYPLAPPQFGVGTLLVLAGWATDVIKKPSLDKSTWLAVLPLAIVHTLGNTFTNVSLGLVAVSFTHTIKAMEPFFSVALSSIFLAERPTPLVLLSLLPIVTGVAIASTSEISFNWKGFFAAMGSNLAFQSRNVLSKKTMGKSKLEMDNISLFSLITIVSFFLLMPIAFMLEGDMYSEVGMRTVGIVKPRIILANAVKAGFFFHLYQQISYMILERVSPVTHSIGNCIKRVVIIIGSVIFFRNPMSIQSQIGTAVALAGAFFYSQAKRMAKKKSN